MLLTDARVYTLDAENRTADTVVVRDGRIAFVGRRNDVNPEAGEEIVALGGRVLLPGFVDSHAHLIGLARGGMSVNVTGSTSVGEIAEKVAEAARSRPRGGWITGRGWDQNRWPEREFATGAPLTRAAPEHPVSLTRIDGHAVWVNAAAMHAAGITRKTPDPPGGRLLRDAEGTPTGVLIDRAQDLVTGIIPEPGEAETDAAIERAVAACLRVGLVGVQEMGVGLETLAAYRRLIERGRFPFRNYAAVMGRSRTAWQHYREHGPEVVSGGQEGRPPSPFQGEGSGVRVAGRSSVPWPAPDTRLTIRAVKFMADGALGSRGAAMHEPYADEPSNTGLMLLEPEDLERLVREAAAAGFQPCTHAIGDRANTVVLDTYARVLAEYPDAGRDRRFRVEHAQILRRGDIPRFHQLGVLPSMQATHCTSDMPWAEQRIGAARLPGAYAWRSLLDSGAIIPGGSDFPVEDPDPLHGIYAAVTRRPREGNTIVDQPDQHMTRLEAIRSFTTWAAYAAFEERVAGTIEQGKRADLVVLDDDPFTCAESRLADIPVAITLVGGSIVYRREQDRG